MHDAGRRSFPRSSPWNRCDAAGRRVGHTDSEGHQSLYTRDGAGRLIGIDSPDAGRITQQFDATVRIRERASATGARVTWSYDLAGRLERRGGFNATGVQVSTANFQYDRDDDPSASHECGLLTAVDDDAGHLALVHDAEGSYGAQTFVYADDDDLLEFAGFALEYGGLQPHTVTRTRGQQLDYDAAGQLVHVTGDGPLTAGPWSFEPHGRLSSLTAEGGRRVQHDYDDAGKEAIRREYDAAGQLAHETLYFTPVAEVRDGKLVRCDLGGAPRQRRRRQGRRALGPRHGRRQGRGHHGAAVRSQGPPGAHRPGRPPVIAGGERRSHLAGLDGATFVAVPERLMT